MSLLLLFSGMSPLLLTDTEKINLPVNCIMAGDQDLVPHSREWSFRESNYKFRPKIKGTPNSLSTGTPSFTTRTDKRGYD